MIIKVFKSSTFNLRNIKVNISFFLAIPIKLGSLSVGSNNGDTEGDVKNSKTNFGRSQLNSVPSQQVKYL